MKTATLILILIFNSALSKRLTFVIDTAESMKSEIINIQNGISSLIANTSSTIQEYVVVPFNEPDIGQITITTSAETFISVIGSLSGGGVRDCPEISLDGLQRGLESSQPKSQLYLFTDAVTNDYNSVDVIKDLCTRTSSQVSIILTRSCSPKTTQQENTSVYQEIADACGGQLLAMNPYNLRYVFRYIEATLKHEPSDFNKDEIVRCDNTEHTVALDSSALEAFILISGNIFDSHVVPNSSTALDHVIRTRNFQAYLVKNPKDIKIRCSGQTTVQIAVTKDFSFQLGFSMYKPTLMIETSSKPLPNYNCYMLVRPLDPSLVPITAEIISLTSKDSRKISLTETQRGSGVYVSEAFTPPGDRFRIVITVKGNGIDQSKKSKDLEVQKLEKSAAAMKPSLEIIEFNTNDADYGDERILACKVTGYPKPVVWWYDDQKKRYETTVNILESPNVFISYTTINNIVRNGTYTCYAQNSEGQNHIFTKILVKFIPKFEVIEHPTDQTIRIDSKGTLHCQVDAKPEATTIWYYNNSQIYNNNINIEDGKLTIQSMSLDDIGVYSCEVKNDFENRRFDAVVTISGLEAPTISFDTSDTIRTKTGSSLEINCRAQGKPNPTITWKFRKFDEKELKDVPFDVSVYDGRLSIYEVKAHHRGVYRCEGDNVIGTNCRDLELMVGSPPIIKDIHNITELNIKMQHLVELSCNVESDSSVTVRWKLTKDGAVAPINSRHIMDNQYTIRFHAGWDDGGVYTCTADNEAGTAEKNVTVNVLVPPYIETRSPKTLLVNEDEDVTIPCELMYGFPKPDINWVFKPLQAFKIKKTLSVDSQNSLFLRQVTSADEGEYLCSAINDLGYDEIKVTLRIDRMNDHIRSRI